MPKKDIPAYVAALVKRADLNISDEDKETLLRDVKNGKPNRKCMNKDCTKWGSRNYKGEKRHLYCVDHELANMRDVINKMCEECDDHHRLWCIKGETEARYCGNCKTDDMINVVNKRCVEEGCNAYAGYAIKSARSSTHCREHKSDDMVEKKHKKCLECKKVSPSYGIEGSTVPTHCAGCATKDMQDVKHPKCKNCKKLIASFNDKGNKNPLYCSGCKAPDMINVAAKKCAKCKEIIPSYGFEEDMIATHCVSCKTEDMIDVKNIMCEKCNIRALFNFQGEEKGIYCNTHKFDGMVDVVNKRCSLCKLIHANRKYRPYCSGCHFFKNPDDPRIRNYKTKEQAFTVSLKVIYPDATLDKKVDGGCSKRRPDFAIDCLTHVVIVEIDENQHVNYDSTCEIQRVNDLYTDYADRNIIFIRLNPDKYINGESMINGVFDKNMNKDDDEFKRRFEMLKETVQQALETIPDDPITTIELYYSE